MAKRVVHLSAQEFTSLFYLVMLESEDSNVSNEDDHLYSVGLEVFGTPEKAAAFETRFLATLEVMERPELEAYVEQSKEGFKIHPAIFEAACSHRVRMNGRFPEKPFLKAVQDAASKKYDDFEFGV